MTGGGRWRKILQWVLGARRLSGMEEGLWTERERE